MDEKLLLYLHFKLVMYKSLLPHIFEWECSRPRLHGDRYCRYCTMPVSVVGKFAEKIRSHANLKIQNALAHTFYILKVTLLLAASIDTHLVFGENILQKLNGSEVE